MLCGITITPTVHPAMRSFFRFFLKSYEHNHRVHGRAAFPTVFTRSRQGWLKKELQLVSPRRLASDQTCSAPFALAPRGSAAAAS
eukprot:COSAG03_NODE_23924_length_276_cov_0.581921_1_plen_84_part_10